MQFVRERAIVAKAKKSVARTYLDHPAAADTSVQGLRGVENVIDLNVPVEGSESNGSQLPDGWRWTVTLLDDGVGDTTREGFVSPSDRGKQGRYKHQSSSLKKVFASNGF